MTLRQKKDLYFIEEVLYLPYEGSIHDKNQVQNFIDTYIDEANEVYHEKTEDLVALYWDLVLE